MTVIMPCMLKAKVENVSLMQTGTRQAEKLLFAGDTPPYVSLSAHYMYTGAVETNKTQPIREGGVVTLIGYIGF